MTIGDLKSYVFTDVSATNSGNVVPLLSSFAVKGQIVKVAWKSGNFAANGSVHIYASGNSLEPDELLLGMNQCSGNRILYPRTLLCDSGGTAIPAGDNRAGTFELNNYVTIWGSGCGASKSGAQLTMFYR